MSDLDRLADDYNAMRQERDDARDRARRACQILIKEIGAEGPADVEVVAERAACEIQRLRDLQEETEHQMHLRIRAGYDKAIADSWRAKVAEVERERDEIAAQRDNLLDAAKEGAWMARALDAERHRDVLKDQLKYAESYMERQLLAVKQECAELRDYAETVGLQAVTDASETYKVVVGERDIAEAELARVKKERDALRDALQWYVDHDDTNEGGRWEQSNAGWLEGKRRAQALLGRR